MTPWVQIFVAVTGLFNFVFYVLGLAVGVVGDVGTHYYAQSMFILTGITDILIPILTMF